MTLEEIKDQVAKEFGDWKDWTEFKSNTDLKATHEYMYNEVLKRYATECVKASQKCISDQADVYANDGVATELCVKQSIVTSEENIVLL